MRVSRVGVCANTVSALRSVVSRATEISATVKMLESDSQCWVQCCSVCLFLRWMETEVVPAVTEHVTSDVCLHHIACRGPRRVRVGCSLRLLSCSSCMWLCGASV